MPRLQAAREVDGWSTTAVGPTKDSVKKTAAFASVGVALGGLALGALVLDVGPNQLRLPDLSLPGLSLPALSLPGTGTETSVQSLEPGTAETAPVLERPQAASRQGARRPNVDGGWVRRTASSTGVPEAAVRAYGTAVLGLPKTCALGWTTLAGIGFVESQHGTIDGRTLGEDGRSSEPILGPALDGQQFAAIRATPESTAMHGNPTWDHALGAMQFIPSTWKRWARDGDRDGVMDPHDLDDAAASAAAYLCHDKRDLTTSAGWNAAVFSYNHDNAYVVAVHAAANRYGQSAR